GICNAFRGGGRPLAANLPYFKIAVYSETVSRVKPLTCSQADAVHRSSRNLSEKIGTLMRWLPTTAAKWSGFGWMSELKSRAGLRWPSPRNSALNKFGQMTSSRIFVVDRR